MDKYNFNYKTTYQDISDNDMQDMQYKQDYLSVFNHIEYPNDNSIIDIIDSIHNKLYQLPPMATVLLTVKDKYPCMLHNNDSSFCFAILWNIDTFHIIHRTLEHWNKFKIFAKDDIEELIDKINNIKI